MCLDSRTTIAQVYGLIGKSNMFLSFRNFKRENSFLKMTNPLRNTKFYREMSYIYVCIDT